MVVITGYSTVPSAVEAMKLGACDYLSKPFTADEIRSAVKDALKGKEKAFKKKRAEASDAQKANAFPTHAACHPAIECTARLEQAMSEIRKKYEGRPEELIKILQEVQGTIGYLPEKALMQIAQLTKLPPATVYGVASFYEQFRLAPVGKHIVKVCRGTACHVRGASQMLDNLSRELKVNPGGTTEDLSFSFETVACVGTCFLAPVLTINEDYYVDGVMG